MKSFKSTLLYFLLLFCSCNGDRKEKMLTNDNIKYWDEYDLSTLSRIGAFSFSKDHKCRSFNYNRQGERKLFYSDDVIYEDSNWAIKPNNILVMEGFERKILMLSADTLLLQNIITKDSVLLVVSPKQ